MPDTAGGQDHETAAIAGMSDPSEMLPYEMSRRGGSPVLVGRAAEMAALAAAFDAVRQGGPAALLIGGEAGVGKTRLVREFWRRLGGQPEQPLLRSGRCLSYGHGITYWPLGDVLKEHFGILESDPPEVAALVSLIVTINAWNAIGVSTRAWAPGSYQP